MESRSNNLWEMGQHMDILLVSAGIFHPPVLGRYYLKRYLHSLGGFSYHVVGSLESLPKLDRGSFQSMVLYYHQAKISWPALKALEEYIYSGGGALAIHSATASFKDSSGYYDVLGGRFTGHGPVRTIEIKPAASQEAIFAGIPAFNVTDELYLHELRGEIQVQFYADYHGEHAPMVWTHTYGQGRVCYACPGHHSSSLRNPIYLQILGRALAWTCHANREALKHI
jgi:type 1 glutamine amidotransferase